MRVADRTFAMCRPDGLTEAVACSEALLEGLLVIRSGAVEGWSFANREAPLPFEDVGHHGRRAI